MNIPNVAFDDLNGMAVTRLGKRHAAQPTIQEKDPRGKLIYWVGPVGDALDAEVGTDFHAIANNKVSITPLKIDMTDYSACAELEVWVETQK